MINKINGTRIDMHNHTLNSDGELTLNQVCFYRKNIIDTICITDHYPSFIESYSNNKKNILDYKNYIKNNTMQNLPNVIIGMEYAFDNWVELLLFGDDFIKEVIKYNPSNYEYMNKIAKNNEYAMIICHPIRGDEFYNETLLSMAQGIEITTRGYYLEDYKEKFKKIKEEYNLHFVSNVDFHYMNDQELQTYNIIKNKNIKDEKSLIKALNSNVDIINIIDGELVY